MNFRKPLFFATFGAIGCLLGALIGEAVLTQVMPERTSRSTAVDVLFVLDITGSMSNEIDGVKNGIARFVSSLGVNQNPKDPLILGLKNLSQRAWLAHLPDGSQRTIDPGQSVKLSEGGRIDFGTVVAEITAHGKA